MAIKFKYRKIAIVTFITVLIWVWADLALDETLPDKPAVVVVDESANIKHWVSFSQASMADIRLTLSGPHTAVAKVNKKLKEGDKLEFIFDAAQEGMNEPRSYTLNLLLFLQKDKQLRLLGLKVKSCEPETLDVQVVKLVKKQLTVECFDESKMPLKAESIIPEKVDMLVPEDWEGEKLVAKVQMIRREINQARLSPVAKAPFIEMPAGRRRESSTIVKVTMPPAEDALKNYTITTATLGFLLSENLQGKYEVRITNLNEVISNVAIRATPEAKQAYESMRYQVSLEIDDGDTKNEECRREVVYNFPERFVSNEEIVLNQTPVQARFKLIPLSAETE